MATQTGSTDTFVEAKPGSGAARGLPTSSTPGGPSGVLVMAGIAGGLLLGALLGYGMSGGTSTVETLIGPSKLQVAPGQDQAITDLRNTYQTLESDKRAATDALATAVRLDQIPARFRGKTTQETLANLATADADLGRLAAPATLTNATPTPGTPGGVKPLIGASTGGLKYEEIKPLVTQLDGAIGKSALWLTAYHKFGENAAFDDNCRKLARVLASIGAVDDPAKVTLAQLQGAVRAVQRDNRLKDDAVVGVKTWAAIKKLVDEKRKA